MRWFGHFCKGFRSLSGLTWMWRGLGKLTSSFFCNLGDGDVKVKSMWVDVSSRVVRTTDPPVNRRVWRFSCRLPQWKSCSMLADYPKPWRSLQPALNGSFATKLNKWLLTTYCTLTFAIYTWYILFQSYYTHRDEFPAIYSNPVYRNFKIIVEKNACPVLQSNIGLYKIFLQKLHKYWAAQYCCTDWAFNSSSRSPLITDGCVWQCWQGW